VEAKPRALSGDSDFARLWAGQTVSLLGTQVSLLAIPLTAAVMLGATAGQMGLLRALEFAPFIGLGLFAGVWIDRVRRRPVMIAADLGRALLLASVPLAAISGRLTLAHLFGVALLVGCLTVLYEVASRAFLPSLVARERLADGNARLELSRAATAIVGPGLGGALVGMLTAPVAVAFDCVTFLLSAASVSTIAHREPAPSPVHRSVPTELAEGFRTLLGSPILRALVVSAAMTNLAVNIVLAILVLYLSRDLALPAGAVGAVFAAAGLGGVAGALLIQRASRRVGVGPAIAASPLIGAVGGLLVPAGASLPGLALPLILVGALLFGLGQTAWIVATSSLRQALTPDRLQGRVTATYQFLAWGMLPLGSLLGGVLGDAIGLPATLVVGGCMTLLALPPLLFSPLLSLRQMPSTAAS
jgi:MFS family permease